MSDIAMSPELRDRVVGCCPGLRIEGIMHRSDKAVVLTGMLADLAVVAKILLDTDTFWQTKFAAEIDTYRAFMRVPPPVPAPKLVAADPGAGVLITTRLAGALVSRDRYPTLTSTEAAPLLQAAEALQTWTVADETLPIVWDYPHRFRRYRADYGLLTRQDEEALLRLTEVAGPVRPGHGDLLPANVLHTGNALTGVLDWEFTGRFLRGIDAALLWILLGAVPQARERAEQLGGSGIADRASFWVNVATLCVRELRTHGELSPGPLRQQRLAHLETTWTAARGRFHELARQL
ncbi:3-hydroxyasparagine phosphotransferase [Actinoplanes capillaceus]|uniref:3-hydroxyasparagine phosphotransferase n=1 Tax=Actinoplanes campanulatus TaxID=113559 RepID=A0ABQ3WYT5_9ACTN|nr:aminoglycoside phosphotransferase family protein [Actinoplanes capillaceus]GID51432.1 3-hydroxyasparagine phosphotransferase [Actinoplanes capillaceus]